MQDEAQAIHTSPRSTVTPQALLHHHARAANLSGKIERGDFGLKWNKALETGGLVVGEDVTLPISAEVTK